MNFNSPQFLFFLPAVIVLFLLALRYNRLRDLLLLVASYYFYMAWNWKYAGLLVLSTVVDYSIALYLAKSEHPTLRRALLTLSLVINLGLLAFFKYYHFALDVTSTWLTAGQWDFTTWYHDFLLPVGISFYTFQTLSYTIDVYRREIQPERDLVKFAVYVAFFPQLVAGPIVRARDFLPQINRPPRITSDDFNSGLFLVCRGLFKKIIFADLLAQLAVENVFRDPARFSTWDLMFAIYGYAFQIYNDFSGYSDIAIGAAAMLGFRLPTNFDRPYVAADLKEFWSRWHISLSTWIRDYLYFPLGGNRCPPGRAAFNLLLTMLLAGLWHGAALNFVAWGAYHGALLVATHRGWYAAVAPRTRVARQILCFHLVCFGWLLFRIDSPQTFQAYLRGLGQLTWTSQFSPLFYGVLLLAVATHLVPNHAADGALRRLSRLPAYAQGLIVAVLVLLFCGCSLDAPSFIYFQF